MSHKLKLFLQNLNSIMFCNSFIVFIWYCKLAIKHTPNSETIIALSHPLIPTHSSDSECPTPTLRKRGLPKYTAEQKEQAMAAKRLQKEEIAAAKMVVKQSKGGRIEKSKSALIFQ